MKYVPHSVLENMLSVCNFPNFAISIFLFCIIEIQDSIAKHTSTLPRYRLSLAVCQAAVVILKWSKWIKTVYFKKYSPKVFSRVVKYSYTDDGTCFGPWLIWLSAAKTDVEYPWISVSPFIIGEAQLHIQRCCILWPTTPPYIYQTISISSLIIIIIIIIINTQSINQWYQTHHQQQHHQCRDDDWQSL